MAKFNEFLYELLSHPTYSPDLASYDYFLFPNLKKFGGKRLTTRKQLIEQRLILKDWTNHITIQFSIYVEIIDDHLVAFIIYKKCTTTIIF